MPKNILVLTGSPRQHGNSEMLADAFCQGARKAGHEVMRFSAAVDAVKPCVACDACWSKGEACVFADGFRKLSPLLEKTDTLVLTSPLYWYTFTAQIKSAIDKMYAYASANSQRKLGIREAVLLMCAEEGNEECFLGAVESYKRIAGLMEWENRGILTAPGVRNKGDIANHPALKQAEALAASL